MKAEAQGTSTNDSGGHCLVPVGGDNPGEGVAGDHKAGGVLELPRVLQSSSSRSEYCMTYLFT